MRSIRLHLATFACAALPLLTAEAEPGERRRPTAPCAILQNPVSDTGNVDANLWPGGIVPYEFDASFNAAARLVALEAMGQIEEICAADFVPRSTQADYVVFVESFFSNSSFIGPQGGPQPIFLADWDLLYVVQHEIMHALGVHHEHQRPDRDQYVIVHFDRVLPGFENNFTVDGTAFGDYDFESIMHYPECSFTECIDCEATPTSCRTMELRPEFAQWQPIIGNTTEMSAGDRAQLAHLYPPDCGIAVGNSVRVRALPPGATLSVHTCAASNCTNLGVRTAGAVGLVAEGPTTAGDDRWWRIVWGDGLDGWSRDSLSGSCAIEVAPAPPDTVPPTIQIDSPQDGATVSNAALTVTGVASDPATVENPASGLDRVEVRLNLGNWESASGTASWSRALTLLSGLNTIDARSRDQAGNASQIRTVRVTFTPPDVSPPLVQIGSPTIDSVLTVASAAVTLGGSASDNVGVTQVSWSNNRGGSGAAGGTTTWSAVGIPLQVGLNVITITARDAAGNESTDTINVTFTPPDVIAPTIQITQPTTDDLFQTSGVTVDVRGTAGDNVAVVEVTWANAAGGRGFAVGATTWSARDIPLSAGDNRITITARDAAGNAASDVITVRFFAADTRPPTTPTGLQAAVVEGKIVVQWQAASDLGAAGIKEYQVLRDGGILATTSGLTWTDETVAAGVSYCYTITAVDNSANVSTPSEPACAATPAPAATETPGGGTETPTPDESAADTPAPSLVSGAPCTGAGAALMVAPLIGLMRRSRRTK